MFAFTFWTEYYRQLGLAQYRRTITPTTFLTWQPAAAVPVLPQIAGC